MIKSVIKRVFHFFGYELAKSGYTQELYKQISINTMDEGLSRIHHFVKPSVVVDIGAAEGYWTEKALRYWPQSSYYLFEPLHERVLTLQKLKDAHPELKIEYIKAAVGKENGLLNFSVTSDLDGSGFYEFGNLRKVEVVSLDNVLVNVKGPFLLKFDTHGFEMQILEGAIETLKETELIVIEVYGFYVSDHGRLFWEICEYLDKRGFRLIDIVDLMRRPKDLAFWQCDAFFIKKNHHIFLDNTYK